MRAACTPHGFGNIAHLRLHRWARDTYERFLYHCPLSPCSERVLVAVGEVTPVPEVSLHQQRRSSVQRHSWTRSSSSGSENVFTWKEASFPFIAPPELHQHPKRCVYLQRLKYSQTSAGSLAKGQAASPGFNEHEAAQPSRAAPSKQSFKSAVPATQDLIHSCASV